MRFPHGSRKSSPRPGRISTPASSRARRTASLSSTTSPRWRSLVGRLRAALAEREELVAHVDEGHPRRPAAQLELEDPAVERRGLVDVADLERDVVHPDQAWAPAGIAGSVGRDTTTAPRTYSAVFEDLMKTLPPPRGRAD